MQPITVVCFVLVCSIGAINCTNNTPQKDDSANVGEVEVEDLDLTHGNRVDLGLEQQRRQRATCIANDCNAFCVARQYRGVCVKERCKCI